MLCYKYSKYLNMKCYIYRIRNMINQKCYIGLTTKEPQKRWKAHQNKANLKTNRVLYNAINKYGINTFSFEVLETYNNISFEELLAKEIEFIKQYKCLYPLGYNMTMGGEGTIGIKLSMETRQRMSVSRLGKKRLPFSEEHKAKIGLAHRGKKLSKEHKLKLSQKFAGVNNPMYGKKLSEEHRKKLSLSKSQKIIGYLKSPQNEVIEVRNITQFCKTNNLCITGIAKLLKGKHSSYLNWRKIDDYSSLSYQS